MTMKLILGNIITLDDIKPNVEDLVAKTLEHDAFKMLNAYLSHNQHEALKIYHDLLRQKEEPIKLVGLLANNIRTMSNVFYLQKKGYHQQQRKYHDSWLDVMFY